MEFAIIILYLIPVIHGFSMWDDMVSGFEELLTIEAPQIYHLAPWIAGVLIIFWPISMLVEAFTPDK